MQGPRAGGRRGNGFLADQLNQRGPQDAPGSESQTTPGPTTAGPSTLGTEAPGLTTAGPAGPAPGGNLQGPAADAQATAGPATAGPGTSVGDTLGAGDSSWAAGMPLKAINPAPVRPGEQKRTVCGVQIIGTGVSPTALDSCERFVRMTIGSRPDIQQRMLAANVALVILPRDKAMTDVAQFAALRGTNTFDGRPWSEVRGSGGMRVAGGLWAIAVPEENLIETTPDKDDYGAGYSVGLHELAHTIHSTGVSDTERKRIGELYAARKAAGGPWTEAYGASNEDEYFAQATNCFFSENERVGNNGPEWLKTNDRPMYDFLLRLYGTPPTRRQDRAQAGAEAGENVPGADTAVA